MSLLEVNQATKAHVSLIGVKETITWRETSNWWYWVSRGHSCLYILQKVEIWTGVTDAWQTHLHKLESMEKMNRLRAWCFFFCLDLLPFENPLVDKLILDWCILRKEENIPSQVTMSTRQGIPSFALKSVNPFNILGGVAWLAVPLLSKSLHL